MYPLPSQSRQLPCYSQLANLADQQNVLFELFISPAMLTAWLLTPTRIHAVQVEKKSKQSTEACEKQKGIPFYPAGYLHYPTDLLRSRFSRQECLAQLEQELAAAWPQAFLQVAPSHFEAVLHAL